MNRLTPEQHRDECVREFAAQGRLKYDKGQKEHGPGAIWERNHLLKDAGEEAIDSWMYLQALATKRDFIAEDLATLVHAMKETDPRSHYANALERILVRIRTL